VSEGALEQLLPGWDGEEIITRFDRETGAWIITAIHSTRHGPASGGTRMKVYPDLQSAVEDAMRLAEGMTYKWAMTGLERGGGKTVIALPGQLDPLASRFQAEARAGLLRRYGAMVHQLGGLFVTGPDVGTGPPDMDIIAETGSPYIFGRTAEAGGSGDSGPPTALGVFHGICVACEYVFGSPSPAGKRVLVQGIGSVGRPLAKQLADAGAEILCADVDEQALDRVRTELGVDVAPLERVFDIPCDVFAPCALGGILNADTIPRLQCRVVAGSANNQLQTPDDGETLHRRGILYAPDFVINMGGAIALIGIELLGWSRETANQRIVDAVSSSLREVFERSRSENVPTTEAARQLAEERLRSGRRKLL
jgi:leucine dehydrogenase